MVIKIRTVIIEIIIRFSGRGLSHRHMARITWAWWRHQMETFSALLAICAGNSPVPGEFPTQRPVTRSIDVFFDFLLNKQLNKKPWCWWFETPWWSLWRHCNGIARWHPKSLVPCSCCRQSYPAVTWASAEDDYMKRRRCPSSYYEGHITMAS